MNCGNEVIGKGRYCSAGCKQAAYRNRTKAITVTLVTDKPTVTDPCEAYLTDATGQQHKIDYEGRRRDLDLLLSWANGNGTAYQQQLGQLAIAYAITL